MSLKVNAHSISICLNDKPEIDYAQYAQKLGQSPKPFVEIEFVDEEEGFVGVYPGVIDACGIKVDRTTAGSLLRICRFMHKNHSTTQKIEYALNEATITIFHDQEVSEYVELTISVHNHFVWTSCLTIDGLRMIGEGLEYALEQFEMSLVGRDTSETAKTTPEVLTHTNKPELVSHQSSILYSKSSEDCGSESM